MGQEALVWQADVSDRDAVAGMVAAAVEHFGHPDVAVANAARQRTEQWPRASGKFTWALWK